MNAQIHSAFAEHRSAAEAVAAKYIRKFHRQMRDDILQASYYGLLTAIRLHNPERGPLGPFVNLACNHAVQGWITSHLRKSLQPLPEAYDAGRDDPRFADMETADELRTLFAKAKLPERWQRIVFRVYGVFGETLASVVDLALSEGRSRARVHQILEKAERQLRKVAGCLRGSPCHDE